MNEPNAQLICRKYDYGVVCDWQGPRDGMAAVYASHVISEALDSGIKCCESGSVYEIGHLKLRVVQYPVLSIGAYCDQAYVMLESPHAQLYWLYREHAGKVIRLMSQIEMRLWAAWRGLMLRPMPEGELLRFTGWLADRLL